MTSWPNIPKGLRKGMRVDHRPSRRRVEWARGRPGKGPYPCTTPGCGLVYTPGYWQEHVHAYHGDMLGKLRP